MVFNYSNRERWSLLSSKCLQNFVPNSSQLVIELGGRPLYHCKALPFKNEANNLIATSSSMTTWILHKFEISWKCSIGEMEVSPVKNGRLFRANTGVTCI